MSIFLINLLTHNYIFNKIITGDFMIKQCNYFEFDGHIENLTVRIATNLNANKINQPSTFQQNLHTHSFFEIFVCKEGELKIKLANNTITLTKDCAIIIPPNLSHIKLVSENSQDSVISFTLIKNTNKFANDLYGKLNFYTNGNNYIVLENCPKLCKTVYEIANLTEFENAYLKALNFALSLATCAEKLSTQNNIYTNNENHTDFSELQRMMELDDIVNNFENSNININEIANKLFISRRQLDRISLKRYGKPLYSVITDNRVISAANKLLETENRIEQIALSVGFNSSNSLYRAFEKKYGLTPNEYRKIYKK